MSKIKYLIADYHPKVPLWRRIAVRLAVFLLPEALLCRWQIGGRVMTRYGCAKIDPEKCFTVTLPKEG